MTTGLFNHIKINVIKECGIYKVYVSRFFFAPFEWRCCLTERDALDIAEARKYKLRWSL